MGSFVFFLFTPLWGFVLACLVSFRLLVVRVLLLLVFIGCVFLYPFSSEFHPRRRLPIHLLVLLSAISASGYSLLWPLPSSSNCLLCLCASFSSDLSRSSAFRSATFQSSDGRHFLLTFCRLMSFYFLFLVLFPDLLFVGGSFLGCGGILLI